MLLSCETLWTTHVTPPQSRRLKLSASEGVSGSLSFCWNSVNPVAGVRPKMTDLAKTWVSLEGVMHQRVHGAL